MGVLWVPYTIDLKMSVCLTPSFGYIIKTNVFIKVYYISDGCSGWCRGCSYCNMELL